MPASNKFVLCVSNQGYEVSLEPRKLYQVLPDRIASSRGQIRVVDESGEDYLFPKDLFAAIKLPVAVRKAVLAAA